MPSVDLPAMTDESKEQQLNEDIKSPNDNTEDIMSPSDVSEHPTNGAGDALTDDSDDDSRKLFVGGLSWETTENDLKEYFSHWGKVTQCIIKLDRLTGNSRGFGFVTMENEDCVSKVLSSSEHWLNNKKIDPKKAKPSREPLKKVFVGGIDPDVTEEQIREYFSTFGKVESLDLPFDNQKGKRKHYIFVSFSTEAAARKAIAKERQEIFGRQCDVRAAVTREQANRQKALKHFYNRFDPNCACPGFAFGDYANVYPGFDPYTCNYFGFDYFGNAAALAGYDSNVRTNHHQKQQQPQQQQPQAQQHGIPYPCYGNDIEAWLAYPGLAPGHLRNLIETNKVAQGPRNSAGTTPGSNGAAAGGGRLLGTGLNSVSMPNHHHPHNQPNHNPMNFAKLLNPQLEASHHPHHPPMSTGLDFTVPHAAAAAAQTAGMVAGAAGGAGGYAHPQ